MQLDIMKYRYANADIRKKRKDIASLLTGSSKCITDGAIKSISTEDMKLLFKLYDGIFLDNWFTQNYKGKIRFSLSQRMTKSAGKTLCPKNPGKIKPEDLTIEIRIGVDFFFQYDLIDSSKAVCGIKTSCSLEALQLVFEHELCHAMEFILFGESSCSRQRFKSLASSLFGHTESYHKLPTHKEIASQRLGLKIGDTVSFSFDGEKLTGILYNINKRATVMVRDPKGTLVDKPGNRYTKYYVPLAYLSCP
jgi:hypothetical protein